MSKKEDVVAVDSGEHESLKSMFAGEQPKAAVGAVRKYVPEIRELLMDGFSVREIHNKLVKKKVTQCSYTWFATMLRSEGIDMKKVTKGRKSHDNSLIAGETPTGGKPPGFQNWDGNPNPDELLE